MNSISIALFLHMVGALGVFVALGPEWTGLQQLRNANLPEQVRDWMGILKSTNKVAFPSMLTTVITGIYMVLNGLGTMDPRGAGSTRLDHRVLRSAHYGLPLVGRSIILACRSQYTRAVYAGLDMDRGDVKN